MLKKYFYGLAVIIILIAWLVIDEKFGYLGSIILIVIFTAWKLAKIAKIAKSTPPLRRFKNGILNGFSGFIMLFFFLSSELDELNFAFNSNYEKGKVVSVIKDTCKIGARRKNRSVTDCWEIEVSSRQNIFKTTSFSDGTYNINDEVFILMAGPKSKDLIRTEQIPFIGSLMSTSRSIYEIMPAKIDKKDEYFSGLKSNFGFVLGAFGLALLLFSVRWFSLLGHRYDSKQPVESVKLKIARGTKKGEPQVRREPTLGSPLKVENPAEKSVDSTDTKT